MNSILNDKSKHIFGKSDLDNNLKNFDNKFINFLNKENGGFYKNNSLHFFGFSDNQTSHSITYFNKLIKEIYDINFDNLLCIGEDIFGNLFILDNQDKYYLFLIESGEFEYISLGFINFINKLDQDIDYYTGNKFTFEMSKKDIELLSEGYRLSPKIPFIFGGNYNNENLIIKPFYENILFNASIYNQIKDLEDGTNVTFKIQ